MSQLVSILSTAKMETFFEQETNQQMIKRNFKMCKDDTSKNYPIEMIRYPKEEIAKWQISIQVLQYPVK